jgi:hypothetical protein
VLTWSPESGHHERMDIDESRARASFEASVGLLEGRRISAVDYWDVHNYGPEPARWDYGDWHHAVMGVQLMTDAGPATVTWTNRFHSFGVEVFPDPIERHLVLAEGGPERVGPDGLSRWAAFANAPILSTTVWWDRWELGPSVLLATGEVVEPARAGELPTALRLDFESGPVWFVAAQPQPRWPGDVFVGGDEIMVVFSGATMRSIGFTDSAFVSDGA